MDEPSTSALPESASPLPAPRYRWWIHLGLLMAYPLASAVLSLRVEQGGKGPLLPTNVISLCKAAGLELLIFGAVFGLAWLASRASFEQLLLRWRGSVGPIFRGLLYSVVLRIAIAIILIFCSVIFLVLAQGNPQEVAAVRPEVENLVDPRALQNPAYLWLNLTFVSFVLAGLREELWRAGVLAGLGALFPALATRGGQVIAVTIAAVIFGLGHLAQGWGGVAMTSLLGFGLGCIMVYRRSIWEAVMAHGFFNATSFALLDLITRYYPNLVPALG